MPRTRGPRGSDLGQLIHPGLPFAVPIRVLTGVGATDAPVEATFFFVDSGGGIAKVLTTVAVENGAAPYVGEPLPHGGFWAITVHDPSGLPLFRSGPLAELPGPAGSVVATKSISVLRTAGASFGLNSPDGAPELVLARLQQVPRPVRVERVRLGADDAGREVVTVEGRLELVLGAYERFAYRLPVSVRPQAAPGHAGDIVVVERDGSGDGPSALAEALDEAIVEGVKSALEAAIRQIAGVELVRAGADFNEQVVSVTSLELHAYATDTNLSVVAHPGAITGGVGEVLSA